MEYYYGDWRPVDLGAQNDMLSLSFRPVEVWHGENHDSSWWNDIQFHCKNRSQVRQEISLYIGEYRSGTKYTEKIVQFAPLMVGEETFGDYGRIGGTGMVEGRGQQLKLNMITIESKGTLSECVVDVVLPNPRIGPARKAMETKWRAAEARTAWITLAVGIVGVLLLLFLFRGCTS